MLDAVVSVTWPRLHVFDDIVSLKLFFKLFLVVYTVSRTPNFISLLANDSILSGSSSLLQLGISIVV